VKPAAVKSLSNVSAIEQRVASMTAKLTASV
jgi:hypothetical protein